MNSSVVERQRVGVGVPQSSGCSSSDGSSTSNGMCSQSPAVGNIVGLYTPAVQYVNDTPCPEKKSLEYFRHNFVKY